MSPDGRFLVWPVADEKVKFKDPGQPNAIHTGSRLRLYDLEADKFIDRFPGFEGDAQELFFSPTGRRSSRSITATGRCGSGTWRPARCSGPSGSCARTRRHNHFVWGAVLSPDGKTLAVTYQPAGRGIFSPFAVRLWDVATGKERHELPGTMYYVTMAFSPDSRLVVTAARPCRNFAREQLKQPQNKCSCGTWRPASASPSCRMGCPPGRSPRRSHSTVGRWPPPPRRALQLWEVATWTLRAEYRGHRDRVNSLPTGRTVGCSLAAWTQPSWRGTRDRRRQRRRSTPPGTT